MKADRGGPPLPAAHLRNSKDDGDEAAAPGVTLILPFERPYDWDATIAFLGPRAIPGVESADRTGYRRTIRLGEGRGIVEVHPVEGRNYLRGTIRMFRMASSAGAVARLRRLFDLDADIRTIEDHLGRDQWLARCLARHPGLRVVGAWDPFEMAVRAILGQQVTVAAATCLAGRLATLYGEPITDNRPLRAIDGGPLLTPSAGLRMLFPRPDVLAGADITPIGIPRARAQSISRFAAAVADDDDAARGVRRSRFDHCKARSAAWDRAVDRTIYRDAGASRAGRVSRRRPWAPSGDGDSRAAANAGSTPSYR